MQRLTESFPIAWNGPHSYSDLDFLCQHYNVNAIVFLELMGNQPMYQFPTSKTEHQFQWPTLYFIEVANIQDSQAQAHLNVVIAPHMAFPHKFCCTLCGNIITNGQIHRFCAKNKSCYYCHRRALNENQYYDALCRTTFCPNNLKNHYAVQIVNKQCPTCHVEIASKSCYDLHIKICQGQKRAKLCPRGY